MKLSSSCTADVELSLKNMAACQPIVSFAAYAYARVFHVLQYEDTPRPFPTARVVTSPPPRVATSPLRVVTSPPRLVTHPSQVVTKFSPQPVPRQRETS